MITDKVELEVLTIVLAIIEAITFVWAWQERQRNRDFKNKAEEWLESVLSISNMCSKLKSDCEQRKVSAQETGGRVDTIGSAVYGLLTGMKKALNQKQKRDDN